MRRFTAYAAALTATLVAALVAATPAQAATSLEEATAALKTSHVFVKADTPGTDATTRSRLQGELNEDDAVVIAMLPPEAASEFEGSAQTFANQLDDATGHRYIVAVSLGNQTAATTRIIDAAVVSDLLGRASSVSTNARETLGTFIRNVHTWQNAHPDWVKHQPPSTDSASPQKQDDGNAGWDIALGLCSIVTIICFGAFLIMKVLKRDAPREPKIRRLPDPPGSIPNLLRQIQELTPSIPDAATKQTVERICERVRVLFDTLKRNAQAHDVQMATEAFEDRLAKLLKVVDRYIRIHKEPQYYSGDSSQHLAGGRQSMVSFDQSVLRSIQRANDGELTEFTVDTRILDATRY